MSGLREQVQRDLAEAMKARDAVRVGALRMLLTAIVNREKELRRELTDDEVREVAAREVKRRTESIEAFELGARADLVAKETAERAILQAYAPEQLGEAELDRIVAEAIAEVGAAGPGDLGKVMGRVMPKVRGRADGALVQRKVRERLGG
ncbi:MAG: aspartyl-tRNA amidotransferase subunit B [Actinomycetota bacterium]|nr:MAG: aspartyl-tRNA amidotransferase subunit B [Actinomycetota bacterium]